MNVLLVYANPEPASFTHALLERAKEAVTAAGGNFEVSDLYGEGFNPVAGRHDFLTVANPDRFHYQTEQALAAEKDAYAPDIRREQDRVKRADMMIFLFPLWWGGQPAILKGWFDRVLSFGFAYLDGTRFETGLFKGKKALFGIVTGGTAKRFTEGGTYGSMQQVLWPIQHCNLEYLGLETYDPFVAYAIPRIEPEERADCLVKWGKYLDDILNNRKEASYKVE